MKHWSSALFPLVLLLTLTSLTYWLRYVTDQPETRNDGKNRHDPDYIMYDATLRKIGESGRLEYTLKADTVTHYPDNETLDVSKPNLVHAGKGAQVTVTADTAHVSEDNERIDLNGNVIIRRAATPKHKALTGATPALTVLPDADKAFTKSPVLVTQGTSWAKGIGLQMDMRAETYRIESRVRAMLESPRARKKTP